MSAVRVPTKVLFTLPFGEALGGAEQVLSTFLHRCDRERIEPVVAFHSPGPMVHEIAQLGIRTAVIPTGRFREPHRMAQALVRLAGLARSEQPDLLAHWLVRAQVYGAPAAVMAGMRHRTMWFQRHLVDGSDRLDRVATRLPALAIGTPSRATAEAQARLRPHRPTFWVHNGIDPPDPPSGDELAAWREQYRIPADRPVAAIVGRLQRWKGQDRFIHALAVLRDRGQDVHGLVVGGSSHGVEPEFAEELHALREDLGLNDHVTFTGHVPDGGRLFALADVAVSASTEEAFGLVLLEAMALGTPVVAVDHGGPAEVIDDGRTGWLVSDATPSVLADGIATALSDEGARREAGLRAREEVEARFTSARMVRELEDQLVALARSPSTRR